MSHQPENASLEPFSELARFWHIACASDEVRGKTPVARLIFDVPVVLYRDSAGEVHALFDRCAHRNVPLSDGEVVDGKLLQCPYHGWCFDGRGTCVRIPALDGPPEGRGRRVPSYRVVEQQGYVWISLRPDAAPEDGPFVLPHLDDRHFTTVRVDEVLPCQTFMAVENFLDVPHTAYLHKGLFRGGKTNAVRVRVERGRDRVEAHYIGEPPPRGLAARILAVEKGEMHHVDRFVLPSITQVEYRLGEKTQMTVTSALTPIDERTCRLFAITTYRLPFAGGLVRPILTPIAKHILQQDIDMLAKQQAAVDKFGRAQYVSTDVDILGSHVRFLMRQAERGPLPDSPPSFSKELTIHA